jgi:hypothetical protein
MSCGLIALACVGVWTLLVLSRLLSRGISRALLGPASAFGTLALASSSDRGSSGKDSICL